MADEAHRDASDDDSGLVAGDDDAHDNFDAPASCAYSKRDPDVRVVGAPGRAMFTPPRNGSPTFYADADRAVGERLFDGNQGYDGYANGNRGYDGYGNATRDHAFRRHPAATPRRETCFVRDEIDGALSERQTPPRFDPSRRRTPYRYDGQTDTYPDGAQSVASRRGTLRSRDGDDFDYDDELQPALRTRCGIDALPRHACDFEGDSNDRGWTEPLRRFLLVCLCEAHRLMPRQRFHFGDPTAPAKDFCDLCRRPARADLAHVIFDCVAPALVAVRLRWKTAVGNALRGAVAVPGRDRLLGAIGLAPLTGRPACELADIATDLTRLFIRHWGAWEFAHRDEIEALPPVRAGA